MNCKVAALLLGRKFSESEEVPKGDVGNLDPEVQRSPVAVTDVMKKFLSKGWEQQPEQPQVFSVFLLLVFASLVRAWFREVPSSCSVQVPTPQARGGGGGGAPMGMAGPLDESNAVPFFVLSKQLEGMQSQVDNAVGRVHSLPLPPVEATESEAQRPSSSSDFI
eukprot:Skav214594  [mRNA]  locus=scaffold57:501584:504842:+ [translate_table: standard]